MTAATLPLLPDGDEVPFGAIGRLLARSPSGAARAEGRALTATVVAIGPADCLQEAAEALRPLCEDGAVRAILIAEGDGPSATARVAGNIVALGGVKGRFIDNAVATLRLSSLPTIVWWRGGPPARLDELAKLADRVVIDVAEPRPAWTRALDLLDRAAFSDLRWTRLTRWRTLMAHFFDVAEVREAAPRFTALEITGSDELTARLFAAWLTTSLEPSGRLHVTVTAADGPALAGVTLGDGQEELTLRLAPSGQCVQTAAAVKAHRSATRTVALGDQRLAALLREELRVRSRDHAFERAIRSVLGRS